MALAGLIVGQAVLQTGLLQPTPSMEVEKAWAALAGPPEKRDAAAAARLGRTALDRDPLFSNALSLLAAIDEEAGRPQNSAILMAAAARQSRRNDVADYYLFNHYIDTGRYEEAMLHADALLRRKFETLGPNIYPKILLAVRDPALVEALAKRLAKNPEWRGDFLVFANQKYQDSNSVYPIYEAMQKAGANPTPAELNPYLGRLLQDERYEQAYLSWIIFLPQTTAARLTNIYDGRFEDWPETPPFGWQFGDGAHGSIEPADAYDRPGKALMVNFDGLRLPKLPGQTLILAPGPYRLTGVVLTTSPESAGRMVWTVNCGETNILTSAPAPDTRKTWVKFSADFKVPDNCKGQRLELKPIAADRRSAIEIWYDDLAIERISSDTE